MQGISIYICISLFITICFLTILCSEGVRTNGSIGRGMDIYDSSDEDPDSKNYIPAVGRCTEPLTNVDVKYSVPCVMRRYIGKALLSAEKKAPIKHQKRLEWYRRFHGRLTVMAGSGGDFVDFQTLKDLSTEVGKNRYGFPMREPPPGINNEAKEHLQFEAAHTYLTNIRYFQARAETRYFEGGAFKDPRDQKALRFLRVAFLYDMVGYITNNQQLRYSDLIVANENNKPSVALNAEPVAVYPKPISELSEARVGEEGERSKEYQSISNGFLKRKETYQFFMSSIISPKSKPAFEDGYMNAIEKLQSNAFEELKDEYLEDSDIESTEPFQMDQFSTGGDTPAERMRELNEARRRQREALTAAINKLKELEAEGQGK
eukprot:Filipodium_phascolosomae@DN1869_c0_g1_i2.p1